MKYCWWKEFEELKQIQTSLRLNKENLLEDENKERIFQVFKYFVFEKDFMRELFVKGQLKRIFEVMICNELYFHGFGTEKMKILVKNLDVYMKYCNPSKVFKLKFSKMLKIYQFVDAYIKINNIQKNKGHKALGLRKRLGFYELEWKQYKLIIK